MRVVCRPPAPMSCPARTSQAPLLRASSSNGRDLREVLAVHFHTERLGQVDVGRVVRGLVEPAATGQELLGHHRHVALRVPPASDERLSAGIGERPRRHAEQGRDPPVGFGQFLPHARDRVLLEGLLAREREVAAARMRQRVIADLVARRRGLLPAVEVSLDRRRHDVQGDLHAMPREHRQALRDLALPPIVERQAERHAGAAGPDRGRRRSGRLRAQRVIRRRVRPRRTRRQQRRGTA